MSVHDSMGETTKGKTAEIDDVISGVWDFEKDADTFEIYLRIAQKRYAEAKEMCNINKDKWPEDSSYDALVRYIDKKAK